MMDPMDVRILAEDKRRDERIQAELHLDTLLGRILPDVLAATPETLIDAGWGGVVRSRIPANWRDGYYPVPIALVKERRPPQWKKHVPLEEHAAKMRQRNRKP